MHGYSTHAFQCGMTQPLRKTHEIQHVELSVIYACLYTHAYIRMRYASVCHQVTNYLVVLFQILVNHRLVSANNQALDNDVERSIVNRNYAQIYHIFCFVSTKIKNKKSLA